jgi:hypothetical protein
VLEVGGRKFRDSSTSDRVMRPFCRLNLATLAGVILFDERKVQDLRCDARPISPSRPRCGRS